MEWKARIEAALENDEFELYPQPLLHLDTGRVTSAEALIRLVDRDVPVPPALHRPSRSAPGWRRRSTWVGGTASPCSPARGGPPRCAWR